MRAVFVSAGTLLLAACSGGSGDVVPAAAGDTPAGPPPAASPPTPPPPPAPPPPPPPATAADPVEECRSAISESVGACMAISSSTLASCYTGSGGVECTNSPDAAIVSALSDMTEAVEATCAPADLTTLLLPSDMMDLGDLLEGQCLQPLTTLASRAYGGPQAQALSDNVGDDACFTTAFTEASRFLESAADAFSTCATDGDCSDVTAEIDSLEASAVAAIAGSCPTAQLKSNVGLTIERLLERTRNDAECQASRLYPDQVEGLTCAPRNTVDAIQVWEYPGGVPTEVFANQTSDGTPSPITQHAPERGQFVQVELDAETTGATCGDGSNYRFWFQLAPEGEPLDRVVVFAPGGGVCTNVLSQDCSSQVAGALGLSSSTSLLNSQGSGIGSQGGSSSLTDFLEPRNPYQNYTKLRLTYCTQDIYAGGEGGSQDVTVTIGGDSVDFTIQRTGGHNIRVASEYLRDVLLAAMNAEGDSYDPASVEAVIAGSSAGGFFTTFNYHFFLDELGWTQSTMVHEWGLGLNDGGPRGAGLRGVVETLRDAWNWPEVLAPYCQEANCVHLSFAAARQFERLDPDLSPRQRIAIVSSQADPTQARSTGYVLPGGAVDLQTWGNTLRGTYCDMRSAASAGDFADMLHFYLPAIQAHGLSSTNNFNGRPTIYDWLTDLEDDFAVSDEVVDSINTIGPTTLDPFGCIVP